MPQRRLDPSGNKPSSGRAALRGIFSGPGVTRQLAAGVVTPVAGHGAVTLRFGGGRQQGPCIARDGPWRLEGERLVCGRMPLSVSAAPGRGERGPHRCTVLLQPGGDGCDGGHTAALRGPEAAFERGDGCAAPRVRVDAAVPHAVGEPADQPDGLGCFGVPPELGQGGRLPAADPLPRPRERQASLFGPGSAGVRWPPATGAGAAYVRPARFGMCCDGDGRRGLSQRRICRGVAGTPRARPSRQSVMAFSQPFACRASRWEMSESRMLGPGARTARR